MVCRVTIGHLRVTVGHLRVTLGHLFLMEVLDTGIGGVT